MSLKIFGGKKTDAGAAGGKNKKADEAAGAAGAAAGAAGAAGTDAAASGTTTDASGEADQTAGNLPVAATLDELAAEFDHDPRFAIDCARKGLSIDQAKAAFYDRAKAEDAAIRKGEDRLKGAGKAAHAGVASAPRVAKDRVSAPGVGAEAEGESQDPRADFRAAVQARIQSQNAEGKACSMVDAIAFVNQSQKELRRQYATANHSNKD